MVDKNYFGESKNIEFKREIPSNHEKFLKDIIAFSNCTGGKVIIGIEDETNKVHGIGDVSPFKLSDSISTMISDACTPQIDPDITVGTIEEKTILIIDIAPGKFRPYYLKSRGKETSTYIRINGTSRPAELYKLKELELEGRNISYDTMQDIGNKYDPDKTQKLCVKMKQIAMDSCSDDTQKENIKSLTVEKLLDFGVLCKVGNADEKMGNADEKMGNADEKMGNADGKMDSADENANNRFEEYKIILEEQDISSIFIENIRKVYVYCNSLRSFSQKDIMNYLNCSKGKATNIMKVLRQTQIVEEVKGSGAGRYKFIEV